MNRWYIEYNITAGQAVLCDTALVCHFYQQIKKYYEVQLFSSMSDTESVLTEGISVVKEKWENRRK